MILTLRLPPTVTRWLGVCPCTSADGLITRILTGDALAGETERLRARVAQLFDRFETQLKQVLREAEMREGLRPNLSVNAAAALLLAVAEGRISQYVRSGFQRAPTENWDEQWAQLISGFFRPAVPQSPAGQYQEVSSQV